REREVGGAVVVDVDLGSGRIAGREAQPNGVRERRAGDGHDAVAGGDADGRRGLNGAGDGEGEKPGGRAERDAWKEVAAAHEGARRCCDGNHWYVSPKGWLFPVPRNGRAPMISTTTVASSVCMKDSPGRDVILGSAGGPRAGQRGSGGRPSSSSGHTGAR